MTFRKFNIISQINNSSKIYIHERSSTRSEMGKIIVNYGTRVSILVGVNTTVLSLKIIHSISDLIHGGRPLVIALEQRKFIIFFS